jgi:hypothetical protein
MQLRTSSAFVLSAMSFNSYASLDQESLMEPQYKIAYESLIEPQYKIAYESQIIGNSWSTVAKKSKSLLAEQQGILGISDIIEMVKVCLGLPNKDMARIFGISRQTLYAYKNSTGEHHAVNASNKERALTLVGIIKEIQSSFDRSPGAMAKNFMVDGKSLLDLMSEPELKVKDILFLADKLAEKMLSSTPKATPMNEVSLQQLTKVV